MKIGHALNIFQSLKEICLGRTGFLTLILSLPDPGYLGTGRINLSSSSSFLSSLISLRAASCHLGTVNSTSAPLSLIPSILLTTLFGGTVVLRFIGYFSGKTCSLYWRDVLQIHLMVPPCSLIDLITLSDASLTSKCKGRSIKFVPCVFVSLKYQEGKDIIFENSIQGGRVFAPFQ